MLVDFLNRLGDKLLTRGGDFVDWLSLHGLNIVLILFVAWVVRRFGVRVFRSFFKHAVRPDLYATKADREKRIRTLDSMVSAFVRAGVYVVAGFLLIGEINPNYTTALFASAGLVTVALGFGAQSLVRDVVSGIFIITENQYRIGDEIELKSTYWSANAEGIVEDINLRTTILRDLDGDVHHVPNGTIGYATNKTLGFNRINENLVLALDTDMDKLEHIINHVGQRLAADVEFKNRILDPPHFERIVGFEEDGVVVKILGKTTPADQRRIQSELYRRLLKAFVKNNIKLAKQKQETVDTDS
jgi:small conductance mechanosensitive channel